MKKLILLLSCLITFAVPAAADQSDVIEIEVLKLDWLDLIPEDEKKMFNEMGMPVLDHTGDAAIQSRIGGVRPELNGSRVMIPGFVIPLEGDADVVTEFLLVPFLGACIHVPPPPPNQIIYVKFEEGAPVHQLWDVVYVVGTLKTQTVVTEDMGTGEAESGYFIEGLAIEEYDDM